MIEFLLDSSAFWRINRDPQTGLTWEPVIRRGLVGSCDVQRAEIRRSARNVVEFDGISRVFALYHPDVPHPKTMWRWIESAQHLLVAAGVLRALSPGDLMICATAAHHGLTVLHDDHDFETAARLLPDVSQHRI